MTKILKLAEKLPDYFGDSNAAAIITSSVNRQYFTSFRSSAGAILVTKKASYFLTDFRYIEDARETVSGVECVLYSSFFTSLDELLKKHNITNVYMEDDGLTCAELARYKTNLHEINFIGGQLDNIINYMRLIKTPSELDKISQAQSLADDGFRHILSFIKPGVTEKSVALELEFFIRTLGADDISFDTIVVSGKNSSKPHGVPTDKPIEVGDFVTMDFGALVDGWHSDMTRTVAVGSCSERQREVYNIVLEAHKKALAGVKAGVLCKSVDFMARDVIEKAGFGKFFGHGTGHGVGLDIHEKPALSPFAEFDEPLLAGSIITIEPGIYLPDEFGVRIEDMVFVTEEGYTNLVTSPKELIIL